MARRLLTLAAAFASSSVASAAVAKDKITELPGWAKALPSDEYSGYLDAGGGKHLHYMLVASESPTAATDPVVIWFNGGPGCSSLDGYYYEHGPFHVTEPIVNTSAGVPELYLNPYRWSQVANVIYLESPAGVGFSYADTPEGIVHNDTSTAEDAYAALTVFFEGFPEFQSNDFYISGESYAGMYVPTLALQVLEHNTEVDIAKAAGLEAAAAKINLKGILVGNGVTGEGAIPEEVGMGNDVEFFFGHGLYNSTLHDAIVKECGDYKSPSQKCEGLIGTMHDDLGHINVYDIYTPCIMDMEKEDEQLSIDHRAPFSAERAKRFGSGGPDGCIDAGAAKKYLDNVAVRKALHVDVPAKNGKDWAICGGVQYSSNFGSLLPSYKKTLIPAIKVLIFNGDVDCCVPYKGNEWWTSSLEIPLKKGWRQWTVDSQTAGYVTSYDSDFTFLTVKGSGHMVPQYRPKQALAMFERFVTGQAFDCESTDSCMPSAATKVEL